MPINIDPSKNPEKIPYMQFVPQIALPSVFNDALSYAEILGKVVATVNSTIDNVNSVAANMTQQVIEAISGAKIPEYFTVSHNGSVMVDTDNWSLDDPEGLYNAVGNGKLCVLQANASFNGAGYAVPNEDNHLDMILTQAWEEIVNGDIVRNVVFVNFDTYLAINVAKFAITKHDRTYSATTEMFFEKVLVTTANLNDVKDIIRNKTLIYRGTTNIPVTASAYIELTDNGTTANLEEYFCVAGERPLLIASDICPCVVVDYYTGNIGEMKYGGTLDPWVRIYSLGITLCDEVKQSLDSAWTSIDSLSRRMDSAEDNITTNSQDIDDLQDDYILLNDNCVQYSAQAGKSDAQKNAARENIGAVRKEQAQVTGSLSVKNASNDAELIYMPNKVDNVTIVNAYADSGRPVIRGIGSPLGDYDIANKLYVDQNSGIDAVKYIAQSKSDAEKYQARRNIGAVGPDEGEFVNNISIEITGEDEITIYPEYASGRSRLFFEGEQSNKVELMNVATPQDDYSAANKAYVDSASGADSVKYIQQTLTNTQKNIARNNIGAVSNQNGEVSGSLSLINTGINRVNLTPAQELGQSGAIVLSDENTDPVRISGVATPVADRDAVNKYYVDNYVGDAIKYDSTQRLSDLQKQRARDNMGAVSDSDAVIQNSVHVEGYDTSAYVKMSNDSETDTASIVFTNGNLKAVKNYEAYPDENYYEVLQPLTVGNPTQNSHAATKQYVDIRCSPVVIFCNGDNGEWKVYVDGIEQRWMYSQMLNQIATYYKPVVVQYQPTEQSDTVTTTAVSWGTGMAGMEAIMYTEDGLNLLHIATDKTFTVDTIAVS